MKRYSQVLIMTFILIISASDHLTARSSVWPMFRHDKGHTGRTSYSGPASPAVKWTFQTDDGIACSPSLGADGTIYFGSGYMGAGVDSSFYALNPDGSLKWTFHAGGSVFSSPAIGEDGTIYFGSMDTNLYAIEDSVTYAKLKWFFETNHRVYCSPILGEDGTVYVGGLDFFIYAIDPAGDLKWNYMADWCNFSSPAIGDEGEIYFGSKDERVYCFEDSVEYEKLRWSHAFGEFYDGHMVDSSPAIGPDGTIYVGVDPYGAYGQTPVPIDTAFYAVNPDGSRKWSFIISDDGTEASAAIGADGMIYIGGYNGEFYAIRDTGEEPEVEWTFSTGGSIDGSATVDGNGVIYFGSRDSTVYALNPDGTLRWSYKTGGGIESSPTIDQYGNLYIGSFDGKMYAFGTGGADVGVESLKIEPEVNTGTTYIPKAVVRNYREGYQAIRVACSIDTMGVSLYRDTVRVAGLGELDSREVGFDPWTVGPDTGLVYNVSAEVILSGDDNIHNDKLTSQSRSVFGATADDDEGGGSPGLFLGQCYPNPFNPSTTIRFGLNRPVPVELKVYNVTGTVIKVLVDGRRGGGEHSVIWNGTDSSGRNVVSGVYFYRLEAGSFIKTRKMILLR